MPLLKRMRIYTGLRLLCAGVGITQHAVMGAGRPLKVDRWVCFNSPWKVHPRGSLMCTVSRPSRETAPRRPRINGRPGAHYQSPKLEEELHKRG